MNDISKTSKLVEIACPACGVALLVEYYGVGSHLVDVTDLASGLELRDAGVVDVSAIGPGCDCVWTAEHYAEAVRRAAAGHLPAARKE